MDGMVVERIGIGIFHDLAQIHDGDMIGDMLYNGQIMGDQHIGQAHFLLQFQQQIQDLGTENRHIQRGNRFVTNHQLGLQRNGPCNADPLPLAAAELVGETGWRPSGTARPGREALPPPASRVSAVPTL